MTGGSARTARGALRRGALAGALLACAGGMALAQPPNDAIGDLIERREAKGALAKNFLAPLLRKSCPRSVTRTEPEAIAIQARRVPLQGVNPSRKTIGELTFVDGFHLTSSDKRFGGLSGLDITDDGNLLAVTDTGDFIWIALAEDGVTPVSAQIAAMRDVEGKSLRGKSDGDAEGLALVDGVALVSFEGNHRILAFDIGKCAAAARGASVATGLPEAFAKQGLKVGSNEGVEALAVTSDWFVLAGVEAKAGQASALSIRPVEKPPEFDIRVAPGAPGMVGLDVLPDGDELVAYSLHRSTSALASSAIVFAETRFARELDQANLPARRMSEIEERARVRFRPVSTRTLAQMNVFVTIDNFEGMAAQRLSDGRVRLFVVSDDNFSKSQRTLLMVYDIAARD